MTGDRGRKAFNNLKSRAPDDSANECRRTWAAVPLGFRCGAIIPISSMFTWHCSACRLDLPLVVVPLATVMRGR